MRKNFLVIGMGIFGSSVARSLYEMGHDVLAVDKNEERVNELSIHVTQAVQMDATDEHALKSLGLDNIDTAFVAIGNDVKASILVSLICKDSGIGFVVAKAQDDLHAKVLKRIDVDRVVFPEREMGIRLAYNLTSTNLLDSIELSTDYNLMEIAAYNEWVGQSLIKLNIRKNYGINVMAIRHKNGALNISPMGEDVIMDGDILVIIGKNEDILRLEAANTRKRR